MRLEGMRERYEHDQAATETFDISSLIDVSFLLLIFFMVTATITPRESDLAFPLPGKSGRMVDPLLVYLVVEADGSVVLRQDGGEEVLDSDVEQRHLSMLEDRLQLMIAAVGEEKVLVQIQVANEAVHQRVIDVMDCLAKNNIRQITFADSY